MKYKKKIKILFIHNNPGIGGGMTALYNHVSRMDYETFDIHITYPRWHRYIELLSLIKGVNTYLLPKSFKFQGRSHVLTFLFDELPFMLRLLRLALQLKPDIFIANNDICQHWGSIVVSKILNIPIIVTMRGGSYRHLSKIDKWLSKYCKRVVFVSIYMSKMHRVFPTERSLVIYDGIDSALYQRQHSNFRKKWAKNEKTIVISILGRIDEWKGHELFIKAALKLLDKYKHVQFFIVGRKMDNQIDYFNSLENNIRNNNASDRIIFTGFSMDVPDVLAGTAILVNASKSEAFGMVVLEGMASGTPVIASKFGGPSEMIDHGENGFLFDTSSAEELELYLSKLIENKVLRKQIGENARGKINKQFTLNSTVENWKNCIVDVLEESGYKC